MNTDRKDNTPKAEWVALADRFQIADDDAKRAYLQSLNFKDPANEPLLIYLLEAKSIAPDLKFTKPAGPHRIRWTTIVQEAVRNNVLQLTEYCFKNLECKPEVYYLRGPCSIEGIELMMRYGLNIKASDPNTMNALSDAIFSFCQKGDLIAVLKLFLQHGVSANLTKPPEPPLLKKIIGDMIRNHKLTKPELLEVQLEIISFLIMHGADTQGLDLYLRNEYKNAKFPPDPNVFTPISNEDEPHKTQPSQVHPKQSSWLAAPVNLVKNSLSYLFSSFSGASTNPSADLKDNPVVTPETKQAPLTETNEPPSEKSDLQTMAIIDRIRAATKVGTSEERYKRLLELHETYPAFPAKALLDIIADYDSGKKVQPTSPSGPGR